MMYPRSIFQSHARNTKQTSSPPKADSSRQMKMSRSFFISLLGFCVGLLWISTGCKEATPGKGRCVEKTPRRVKDAKGNWVQEGAYWGCGMGRWATIGFWKAGKKHGRWMEWGEGPVPGKGPNDSMPFTRKRRLTHYKNGKMHGLFREWYPRSTQLAEESHYKEGYRDGKYSRWHSNGQKLSVSFYKEGQQHGVSIKWHENEKIKSKQYYMDGRFHNYTPGKTPTKNKVWTREGNLLFSCPYYKNEPHGCCELWWKNGKRRSRTFYFHGQKHGTESKWDKAGNLQSERIMDARKTGWITVHGMKVPDPITWMQKNMPTHLFGQSKQQKKSSPAPRP